jgi:tRNA(fMet)-specific endonuclease VapC
MSAAVRFVLDTDAVTYQQRGRPAIVARLAQIDPRQVAVTIATVEEQLQGRRAAIRRQRDPAGLPRAYQLLRETTAYFCRIPVLLFDEAALATYRELLQRKLRIGTQDLRVAAIVLAHRAILVTGNQRHFSWIDGLAIEDWNAL